MILTSVGSGFAEGGKAGDSKAKMEEDFNRFLNLLVTQLKNQDPLDPMDSSEFTSQLVQFASVEQQIHTNGNLENLIQAQEYSLMGSMVSYVNKTAEVSGNKMLVEGGGGAFSYELEGPATSATITIRNQAGAVIYFTGGDVNSGKHTLVWDGVDNQGVQQDDGVYTINVAAVDANGEPVNVKQTVIGRVTAATLEGGNPRIEMGVGNMYDLDSVISIRPSLHENDPQVIVVDGSQLGGSTGGDTSEDGGDAEPDPEEEDI